MNRSIAITGIGLVSPLGTSALQNWDALLAGDAISEHAKALLPSASPHWRINTIAHLAAAEAIAEAQWSKDTLQSPNTAFVFATSKGPVEAWLKEKLALDGLSAPASALSTELRLGFGRD